MAREMRYIAQAFWGARLRPGEPMPFVCATDAEEGAAILAQSAEGVVAYQQFVDDDGPLYDEPEILGTWGRVPAAAISIDGEAADPWCGDMATGAA